MRKNKKIIAEIVALKKGDKLTAKQEAYVKARVGNKAYLKWKGLGEEMFPLIKIKKFYCENCFEENLEKWIELYDGTIVCSPKCRKEWKLNCKENRKSD